MTRDVKNGSRAPDSTGGSVPAASNKHFDTFETTFFAQGDESAKPSAEAEQWSDLDDGRARRFAPSRQRVVAVALGSACLAAIGCVALWRSGGRAHDQPTVAAEPASGAPAVVALAPAPPSAPIPAPAAAGVVPGAAGPAAAAVPVAAASAAGPAADAAGTSRPGAAVPAPAEASARELCMGAIRSKRGKDILSACAHAFAADPTFARAAIAVARVEFERGRTAQALAWAKKAIAIDPDAADAYVFIGGAEQSAGHGKAAKEAYRRYLQLAPSGRYAADLRAIVGTL